MGLFKRKKSDSQSEEKKEQSIAPVSAVQKKKEIKKEGIKTDKPKVVNQAQKAYRILIRPIISEKATIGVSLNKYVFEVALDANKVEIKKAIKEVYGIDPKEVNILNQRSKNVRFGRYFGQTKKSKKAIVTLKNGDSIKLYEGI